VTNVKWDDADAYCKKYGKRLPREEEWELAARGTKGYTYPWGNVWEDRLANVQTHDLTEAGKFPGLSPYGAVDMVGNAWEWTASPLTPYPNGTLSERPAPDLKVIRGGSYIDSRRQATTTYRVGYPARSATDYSKIGFRCVSDAPDTSTLK
jgi:iron(II)-dependent oxidoreductase